MRDARKRHACATTVFRDQPLDFGRLSACGSVVGCGCSAQEAAGCACLCGDDRAVYLQAPARRVVQRQYLQDTEALRGEIEELVCRTGDRCFGGIAVDGQGVPRAYSKAESFPWAYCSQAGRVFYGCGPGEVLCDRVCEAPEPEVLDCGCVE